MYVQNLFAYLTTAYVSLRLGYTTKAGIENYKKIAQNYQQLTSTINQYDADYSEEEIDG